MGYYAIISHKQTERKIMFYITYFAKNTASLSLEKVSMINLTERKENLLYLNKELLV